MRSTNTLQAQTPHRAVLQNLYRAVRERRGLPSKPMDYGQMAAALRAAADGIEGDNHNAFAKGLSEVLGELFAAWELGLAMSLLEPDNKS